MIAEIQAIASLLASEPLTVDTVVRHLGTVTYNFSGNVLVKPYNPQFKEISVVRKTDQTTGKHLNIPSVVGLTFVEPPALETLVEAFGQYKRLRRLHYTNSYPVIFRLDMPGRSYDIVLGADIRQNRAIRITLLREKRS